MKSVLAYQHFILTKSNLSWLISVFLFAVSPHISAQLPTTSMYMMDYTLSDGKVYLRNPSFLSGFNIGGYNNQPSFFNESQVYFTTNKYDKQHTEIAMLDLNKNTITRITKTPESEFSPLLTPDGRDFTTVRIERDGKDQSLWEYPLDRSGYGKRLIPDLENIGYYKWLSTEDVALFLVEDPIELALVNINNGRIQTLTDNIGRCLQLNKEGNLLFVHKVNPDSWYIKSYDFKTKRLNIITETINKAEDFVLLSDGSILMAGGSKIWRYDHKEWQNGWQMVDDLSDLGIDGIHRLAVSSDKLVLVCDDD